MNSIASTGLRTRGLAWRLGVSLSSIVLTLGLVSGSCIWALIDIHRRLHSVKDEEVRARSIAHLAIAVRDQYAHVAHTIILGNDTHLMLFEGACSRLQGLGKDIRTTVSAPVDLAAVDEILATNAEIERLFRDSVLPAVRQGRRDNLATVHDLILEKAMRAEETAERLSKRAEESMEDLGKHVRATQHGAIAMTIAMHLLALVTAGAVGTYLYRSIARPLRALSSRATRVGAGDWETEVVAEGPDELRHLAEEFNKMVQSLKRHQAQLLETEKLAGLARFAAGLAHELNNPIAVISGYAKLLRRHPEGVAESRALKAIDEEADRCHQVIEGLLHLTRGGGIERGAVDLRPLLESVVARLQSAEEGAGPTITVDGEATIEGDRAKLELVFTNLVRNAVEAAGPNGHVLCSLDTSGTDTTITIADDGPGVPPAARVHLFEPFFTTKPNGSGLGLSITKAIVDAHGGAIAVEPSASGGAAFVVSLPGPSSEARG